MLLLLVVLQNLHPKKDKRNKLANNERTKKTRLLQGFKIHNDLLATVAYIILFNCIDFHILPNELDRVILHSTLKFHPFI